MSVILVRWRSFVASAPQDDNVIHTRVKSAVSIGVRPNRGLMPGLREKSFPLLPQKKEVFLGKMNAGERS